MPKTHIIISKNLDAGAVIPQCLDNQFLPDEVFYDMQERNVDYSDSDVKIAREKATKSELNRALVYSSQIVVNRAFLWNNPTVYSNFIDTKENQSNRLAFTKLLGNSVIPYLYSEMGVDDEPKFDLDPVGVSAFHSLMRDLDSVDCLRFSTNDTQNNNQIDILKCRFQDYFLGYVGRSPGLIHHTAENLIPGRPSQERKQKVDALAKELSNWKKELLNKSIEIINDKDRIFRNDLYEKFLCEPEKGAIPNGRFLPVDKVPFLLEKKKLFDLRYNTNLADSLKRYAFTPAQSPSRSALAVDIELGEDGGQKLLQNLSKNIKNTFVEGTQEALSLPLLNSLCMDDIYQIRQLPGWSKYIESQRKILQNPLSCLEYLDEFKTTLQDFNTEINKWYLKNSLKPKLEKKYRVIVRVVVKVAGFVIAANLAGNIYTAALTAIAELPENMMDYAVSLCVDYIPLGKDEIERELGYSLDIVNYDVDVTKDAIEMLVHKAKEQSQTATHPEPSKDQANKSKNT